MDVFFKKKEDLCVAQLLNGMLIIGEDSGDYIKNPIQFSYHPEYAEYDEMGSGIGKPTGMGFKAGIVGDPQISVKSVIIEGAPDINKFIMHNIPKSMCIICNKLTDIEMGSALLGLYNEIMTKVTSPASKLKL